MTTQSQPHQLNELPQQIFQARLEQLDAEQRRIAAENHYVDQRNEHYLTAVADGQGHYQAQAASANAEQVRRARQQRDRYTVEAKRAQAGYQRLRDEMAAHLKLAVLSAAGDDSGGE